MFLAWIHSIKGRLILRMNKISHSLQTGETKIIKLTAAEIAAIPAPTAAELKAAQNAPILAQIAALESRVTARVWREYVSKQTVAGKGGKTPAQFIADIDAQIATLRATLIA